MVRRETSAATDGSVGWWEENCVSDERCWEMLGEALGPSPERASPSKHGGDWKLVEGMASLRSGEGEGKAFKEPGEALSEAGAFGGARGREEGGPSPGLTTAMGTLKKIFFGWARRARSTAVCKRPPQKLMEGRLGGPSPKGGEAVYQPIGGSKAEERRSRMARGSERHGRQRQRVNGRREHPCTQR